MQSIHIPCLDLNEYINGSAEQREAFSGAIGNAFRETGFVTVRNHGVTPELIGKLYSQVEKLFSLPDEVKQKYEIPGLAGQRGYTGKGRETAKGAYTPDLKEFWQIGQEVQGDDPVRGQYPGNVTVDELPEFNRITRQVYATLERAGKYMLQAIAVYLGLEEGYFDDKVYNGDSILRAIHYFPIDDPGSLPAGSVRAGAHEDINLITLLIGASADGLELLTREGKWIPVSSDKDHIVVNVGDMLQRLTNNKLRSTTHRVVNPPEELLKTSRYSVPFFLHPRSGMDLSCLDTCIDEQHPKAYADITAREYLEERLREIGLKK